jgi:nickel-dependent lactate racemase
LAKVENEINKELDKGIFSDKLSSEITEDSKADNIIYKPTTNPNLSQREIVRTNLIEFVRGVDAYLNRSNLK